MKRVSSQHLNRLAEELPDSQKRKAATYVLENPLDVGVLTCEIADAANVNLNTAVRIPPNWLCWLDEFRAPFGSDSKRWLS